MTKLPLLKPNQLIRILIKLGFKLIRQEGSHMFFEHPDGRTTVIPCHPGEEIRRGLLNKIIKKDIKIEKEAFLKLLRN